MMKSNQQNEPDISHFITDDFLQVLEEHRKVCEKEGKLDEFEEGFHQSISKKSTIIKKFSSI